jgi:DnaK suppressor protein
MIETMDKESASSLKKVLEKKRKELLIQIRQLEKSVGQYGTNPDRSDLAKRHNSQTMSTIERSKAEERISFIEAALSRIQDDSYGKCLRCNGDIQIDRLRIYPEAKYCVECQEKFESNRLS